MSRSRGSTTPRLRLEPGASWGGLRVIERVGAGRYGEVYRAWDPTLDRHVALKVLNSPETDELLDTQVIEEGRLMARVRHPNVAAIHGAQRADGVTGLWMEFVEGRTLAEELAERGPFDAAELVAVGTQLGRALAAVHDAGLVHRDVKAPNVLRNDSGRVVLGDFGTGRELDDPVETLEGLVGTPAYLAPEIFARQPATPQSDIYSLGVLLFHLATREYPHVARSLQALRDAHANAQPALLSDRRPDLPAALTRLVDSALDPDPTRRPQSASALADLLDAALTERGRLRRRRTIAAVAVALTVAVAAASWVVSRWARAPFTFAQRDWVLVAAFDNRSGNPTLDGSLEYALELELADSSFVRVAPRERIQDMLALMRLPPETRVDAAIGRDIAIRDGEIRAVVAGHVSKVADGYRLTARILNPADGSTVASAVETAVDDRALLEAIGRVATRVRERLGETLPQLPTAGAGLPKVSTRSLKSLQLYARALPDLFSIANPASAERLLLAAVDEDPEFAVGYVSLARSIQEQRLYLEHNRPGPTHPRRDEIIRYLDRAVALSYRVSLPDQYFITAESELLRAQNAVMQMRKPGVLGTQRVLLSDPAEHRKRAFAAAQALHQVQPDNIWALWTLLELGRARSADEPRFARALAALRPHSLHTLGQVARAMRDADRFDEARDYLARARPFLGLPVSENRGSGPELGIRYMLFEDAWRRNDIQEAVAMLEAIAAIRTAADPAQAGAMVEPHVFLHIALGQFNHAEKLAATVNHPEMRALRMTGVVLRRNRPGDAQALLTKAFPNPLASVDSTSAGTLVELALAAGNLQLARRAIPSVRSQGASPAFVGGMEGRLALLEGLPDRAIEVLTPSCPEKPSHDVLHQCTPLARAYAAQGNLDEAIRVLERVSAVPRELGNPGFRAAYGWLQMRDQLAQYYRQAGRVNDAEPIEAELRVLLSVADADDPIRMRVNAIAGR